MKNLLTVQTDHANVKIHPPVLLVIHIGIAFLLGRFIPLPLAVPDALRPIGLALGVIGFLLGASAAWQFTKAHTTLDPHGSVTSLVTSGVYRVSRNPIYLGFVLMVIGIPLYFGNYWGIIIAPVMVILFNRLVIEHEEAYLEKKFGDVYTSYKSGVRRWL